MNVENYNKELINLGLLGSKGEMFDKNKSSFTLVYSMPDGSNKYLPPRDKSNEQQRVVVIEEIKLHLSIIETIKKNRIN